MTNALREQYQRVATALSEMLPDDVSRLDATQFQKNPNMMHAMLEIFDGDHRLVKLNLDAICSELKLKYVVESPHSLHS